jgi:hypothetical protein
MEKHPSFMSFFGPELTWTDTGPALDADRMSRSPLHQILANGVDRYINIYGLGPLSKASAWHVLGPLIRGMVSPQLSLSLVVPIALTRFALPRFRLIPTCYVLRLPQNLQLARADAVYRGSGGHPHVVSAATHAFTSRSWVIENSTYDNTTTTLKSLYAFPTELIDHFFAALRIVTSIETWYAQMLFVPKRWSLGSVAVLPPVYGVTCRRYPAHFDDFGWSREGLAALGTAELEHVACAFNPLTSASNNRLKIAVRRLNACFTRDNTEDAVLDATTGLEILLGDNDSQNASYKLRMRAAAVTQLDRQRRRQSGDILADVRDLYNACSSIVHGTSRQQVKSKNINSKPEDSTAIKVVASNLLRYIIKISYQLTEILTSGGKGRR